MSSKTILHCVQRSCFCGVGVLWVWGFFFSFLKTLWTVWKNFTVLKLPDIDLIMEVLRGLCKTSSVWALLERSLQWLDFWIIRQTARAVTSAVYGAGANTDKFDSHASVSVKTLVTRSLANGAIRAMETVSVLPGAQGPERWEVSSPAGMPQGDGLAAPGEAAMAKTLPGWGRIPSTAPLAKWCQKKVWAELH